MRCIPIFLATLCLLASCGRDCVQTLCGCWDPATIKKEFQIVNQSGNPLAGVILRCEDSKEELGTTSQTGMVVVTSPQAAE